MEKEKKKMRRLQMTVRIENWIKITVSNIFMRKK